jgi:hypothetical protein
MQEFVPAAALALLLMIPVGTALAANESSHTISSLPSGVLPISDYYNQSVYDAKDNKIGEVLLLPTMSRPYGDRRPSSPVKRDPSVAKGGAT